MFNIMPPWDDGRITRCQHYGDFKNPIITATSNIGLAAHLRLGGDDLTMSEDAESRRGVRAAPST